MEHVVGWLFRRFRRRYVYVIVVASVAILGPAVLAPTVAVGCLFLELPLSTFWAILIQTSVVVVVIAAATTVWSNWLVQPVHQWLGDGDPDPATVFLALRDMPNKYVKRVYGTSVTVVIVLGVLAFARYADDVTVQSLVVTALVACGAGAAGGIVLSVAIELGIRPVTEEVSAALPPGHDLDDTTWSIRARVVMGAAMVAYATGLVAAGVAGLVDEPDDRYLVGLVATIGAGGLATIVFHLGISQPLLRPLRDLLEGTRRVRMGDFSRPVPVTSSDELGQLAQSFNAMQAGLRERAALHSAFGTYVDPGLTQRLLERGDEAFAAETVDLTVWFLDVQGFTAYASTVEPEAALQRLNALFELAVPIVRQHGGHTNHFLGDGLLAVFGAPEWFEDHADRAVAAALEIHRTVEARFGPSLRIGLGCNSGKVIAGAIGGGGKLEYTVIGDVVNVASRVEQLTRDLGHPVLLTDATVTALTTKLPLADAGHHRLRGKSEPVQVYAAVPQHKRPAKRAAQRVRR